MKVFRHLCVAVLLVGVMGLSTGCLGPAHVTGHVYEFNEEIDGKWKQEGTFILLLPVYIVTSFIDAWILNPIYWWTGEHPVSPPGATEEVGL